jgi:hypothetical protein
MKVNNVKRKIFQFTIMCDYFCIDHAKKNLIYKFQIWIKNLVAY